LVNGVENFISLAEVTDKTSFTITNKLGLQDDQIYRIKVRAINSCGKTRYTAPLALECFTPALA